MREFHILNLGAGVQSTTLYLMSMRGEVPKFDLAVFADTQDEPGAVYQHLDWLRSLGGPEIRTYTAGRLGDDLVNGRNTTGRFAAIPAFTTTNQPRVVVDRNEEGIEIGRHEEPPTVGRTRRQCSKEYKTEVIERAIRRDVLGLGPRQRVTRRRVAPGAFAYFAGKQEVHVHQYFGISYDERSRASRIFELFLEKPAYTCHFPLMDRLMTRANCIEWLHEFGNVPHEVPRSACVYCPFHTDLEWARLKTANGADWRRAVEVDAALRSTGAVANRDMKQTMFVHRSCKPLTQIEFHPRENAKEMQLGFGLECEGVCGV